MGIGLGFRKSQMSRLQRPFLPVRNVVAYRKTIFHGFCNGLGKVCSLHMKIDIIDFR